MQLPELLVAVTVFAMGASASLQLTAMGEASQQRLGSRSQLLARIDQDRQQLQARWQLLPKATTGPCKVSALGLETAAATLPLPSPLQRQLVASNDGSSLMVSWGVNGEAQPLRRRLFTPAGLGLCRVAEPSEAAS
jgi:hypothetical protein